MSQTDYCDQCGNGTKPPTKKGVWICTKCLREFDNRSESRLWMAKLWSGSNVLLAIAAVVALDTGLLGDFGTNVLGNQFGASAAVLLLAAATITSYRLWRGGPTDFALAVWATAGAVILGGFSLRAMLDAGDYRLHNCWEVSASTMADVPGDTFFECAPGSEPRQWSSQESSQVCDLVDPGDREIMDTRETSLWAC